MDKKYIEFYKTFHKKFKNDENLILCSKTLSHGGVEMKVTVLLILIFPSIVFGNYDGYKRNSDGSYSVGGMYDGYKRNPNGSYVLGWKCSK